MGFYIKTGSATNKARDILTHVKGSREVSMAEARDYIYDADLAVVCVVDNRIFEAAGFCYNLNEYKAFLLRPNDLRPRRWLLVPREDVNRSARFDEEAYREFGITLSKRQPE